jgi:release factor glutamine methyltransferase
MKSISGKNLFNWYQQSIQSAKNNNISILEIELLLTELTELNNLNLKLKTYQNQDKITSQVSLDELKFLWQQRIEKRCPIQYLIGECYWRDFRFKVTNDVLIPRPETELIIDLALDIVHQHPLLSQGNLLDLGTGSGAIAIALATTFPQSSIYGVDKSKSALLIAQENAHRYNLQSRIKFINGSWFSPFTPHQHPFSLIISNPPYIPSATVLSLQPEVLNHEPKIALDGGEDGLNDIRHLIDTAPSFLINGGFILLEIMAGQSLDVAHLFQTNSHYSHINIHYDLANFDRFVSAQKIS